MESSPVKIEICIDSVESALAAVEGGADRLEICASLALGGGTTPSLGLVRLVRDACPAQVELMAMVRPRTGDFLYAAHEVRVMQSDIAAFADARLGLTGVVLGALRSDGTVDGQTTRALVETAVGRGLQVCFHRAFDMVVDQQGALDALLSINGITRILTSGAAPTAPTGLPALVQLSTALSKSSGARRIEIMPGAGVSPSSARPLLRALLPLGVRALHLSGGAWAGGAGAPDVGSHSGDEGAKRMRHRPPGMGMGVGEGEWRVWGTCVATVRAVREAADGEWEAYSQNRSNASIIDRRVLYK